MPVAERVEGFDRAVAREEGAGFFDEAGGEHGGAARVEAGIELGTRRVEADAQKTKAGERVVLLFAGKNFGHGLAGGEADLDGADQLGCVVGVNARSGCGVKAGEEPVQPLGLVPFGAAAEAAAEVFTTGRAREEAFGEGAEIEACSAGDDGEFVARGDVAEGGASAARVFSSGEGLVGVDDVDEVMRDAGALFGGGLGGAQVHAAVDSDGVAGDDFALEAFGESEREGGFAGAGRAEEEDGGRRLRRGRGFGLGGRRRHRRPQPGAKIQCCAHGGRRLRRGRCFARTRGG